MENETILIMEEIEKEPEKLKQMLRIKEMDELYQFFTENGYKQSFERFKEEVNSLRESLKSKFQEDSDLENVAGGINIKNKLTKTTSIGLASLLVLGAPVGYASNTKVPSKSTAQNTLTKKLLKYITVGGIGATAFATAWGYNKYFGSGNKPKQTRVNDDEPATEVVSELKDKIDVDEQLIKQVLGEDMVEPFRMLCDEEKRTVIELVTNIQKLLGEQKAKNLWQWAHDRARSDCIDRRNVLSWFEYICNVLEGYLYGQKQNGLLAGGTIGVLVSSLHSLILSFLLCENKIDSEKINKVGQCIQYLYDNFEKYYSSKKSNELSPSEIIEEFHWFNGNKEFSNELKNKFFKERFYRYSNEAIIFVHLLHYALKQEFEDLSGVKFNDHSKTLSFEGALFDSKIANADGVFEILKNDKLIGKFCFIINWEVRTATLINLTRDIKYTFDFENGQTTFQKI